MLTHAGFGWTEIHAFAYKKDMKKKNLASCDSLGSSNTMCS